jgi:hypothetical protein
MSTQPADDIRDASLRVAKSYRDALKAYAAIHSRPLYDVTNEAIEAYLKMQGYGDLSKAIRSRAGSTAAAPKKRAAKKATRRS